MEERLAWVREAIARRSLDVALGARLREYLSAVFALLEGDEGSLWLATDTELVLALNAGPRAAELEWHVRQPLSEGIMSIAYRTGTTQTDDRPYHRRDFSHLVDEALGQHTFNVSAAPVRVFEDVIGVLSVVQIGRAGQPTRRKVWGFPETLPALWKVATMGTSAMLEGHALATGKRSMK